MGRLFAVLLALVLPLLASGCGGSGSEDPDRWAGEAAALCGDLERALGTLDPPREVEGSDELAEFVSLTAREVDAWLEAMRKLRPPAGSEAEAERMLGLYGRAVRTTERAADALGAGDEERYRELLRGAEAPAAQADAIARKLGADSCAHPLSG